MPTLRLTIAYDGAGFNGWQIQSNGCGVQALVQAAVRRMTKERNSVIGASRTDAGVHALGQVAHFHTRRVIAPEGWLRGLNSLLPPAIRVRAVAAAVPAFHARRDARWKWYRYRLLQGPWCPPFLHQRVWHLYRTLDLRAMQRAARHLLGEHDFRAFAAANDANRSSRRRIHRVRIRRVPSSGDAGSEIHFDVVGSGFLKQMVRNIVGTLVEVGEGKRSAGQMRQILASRDRRKAGRCAPAGGLCLMEVGFTGTGVTRET